jgi:hypothetical protein
MFKKFLSIFLSKFPDRFACLVIIIGIFTMGSFAYETVGLPIQTATAESSGVDGATASAVNWAFMQKCFGDRIRPETIVTDVHSVGDGAYRVKIDFVSLEYTVDLETGGLHHVPVNHTVDMLISQGKVLKASESMRDLINDQACGPVTDVSRECL